MIVDVRAIAGVMVLALLLPAAAGAQERRNPFAELFGRAPERTVEFTTIDFRTTTGAQIADTIERDFNPGEGDVPEGIAAGADADLTFEHFSNRVQAQGHARYAYQEYRQDPPFGTPAYQGDGQVTLKASSRLSFDAGGRYTQSPFFQLMQAPLFDASSALGGVDPFIAYLVDNTTIEGRAGLTANYSKRSSLSAWGSWRETEFPEAPGNNFSARGFRGQWRRQMSRDLAAHVGYGREEVRQRSLGNDRFMNELIDIGIDYMKALPIARRTTVGFNTETAVMRENGGKGRFRLNGGIDVYHGFQRTWRASLGVHRLTEFLPGFAAPVFSDRARGSLSGYLTRRFIFYANAEGGRGVVGFGEAGTFRTWGGDTRLTFAATRHIGIFTQYVYYHYQMPPTADSIVLQPRLSRQAVSFGFQTWVPLMNKEKVNSDPR